MSSKNLNIKDVLTKAVTSTTTASKGKKSKGTVIGTIVRDVQIIAVEPFSL